MSDDENSCTDEYGVVYIPRKPGTPPRQLITETIIYEPDKYFHLPISCAHSAAITGIKLHPVLHEYVGRVMKGGEWEFLGINPYTRNEVYSDGCETLRSWASYLLERQWWGFSPVDLDDPGSRRLYAKAISKKMRCVTLKEEPYILRLLGISYDEVASFPAQYERYADAMLAADKKDYAAAIEHAKAAIDLNPKEVSYQRLLFDARAAIGDLTLIFDGISYYKNDMDGAVHCGDAEKWLRLSMDINADYRLVFDVVSAVLAGLDLLISGGANMKARIYGVQRKEFYLLDRAKFVKRLGSLKGFLSPELVRDNIDRPADVRGLLLEIERANPEKLKKINSLMQLL